MQELLRGTLVSRPVPKKGQERGQKGKIREANGRVIDVDARNFESWEYVWPDWIVYYRPAEDMGKGRFETFFVWSEFEYTTARRVEDINAFYTQNQAALQAFNARAQKPGFITKLWTNFSHYIFSWQEKWPKGVELDMAERVREALEAGEGLPVAIVHYGEYEWLVKIIWQGTGEVEYRYFADMRPEWETLPVEQLPQPWFEKYSGRALYAELPADRVGYVWTLRTEDAKPAKIDWEGEEVQVLYRDADVCKVGDSDSQRPGDYEEYLWCLVRTPDAKQGWMKIFEHHRGIRYPIHPALAPANAIS